MTTLKPLSSHACFGGLQQRYQHSATTTQCDMTFSIFLPPHVSQENPAPVLYWLSGLTCTDENFVQKAGAQRIAAELGLIIVCPDTSPRGDDVPDCPDNTYSFGKGAGFYLDATEAPYSKNYKMYSYITEELPSLIQANFPVSDKASIFGHSMGGHGALTIGLKHPEKFASISAFSPICHPTQTPWGQHVFPRYLGDDKASWEKYDASLLLAQTITCPPILVDQGLADEFLEEQLSPNHLQDAAKKSGNSITLDFHEGYGHSYFFIATFIEKHLRFHWEYLK